MRWSFNVNEVTRLVDPVRVQFPIRHVHRDELTSVHLAGLLESTLADLSIHPFIQEREEATTATEEQHRAHCRDDTHTLLVRGARVCGVPKTIESHARAVVD